MIRMIQRIDTEEPLSLLVVAGETATAPGRLRPTRLTRA
jgi:hypothetical protein